MTDGPSPPRPGRWLPWVWLAVGLGLRLTLALSASGQVAEYESDGFVRSFEGWRAGELNRMRPAGVLALDDLLGRLVPPGSVVGLRLACVGVSVFALACAALLVGALLSASEADRSRRTAAWSWLAGLWALWPSLVGPSIRPLGASATGAAACLVLAAAVAWWQRRSLPGWILLSICLSLALMTGGVAVAAALVAAVLLFLAPLPRVQVAAPVALALLLAGCLAWLMAGGAWNRPVLPEGAAPASIVQLAHMPPSTSPQAVHPDERLERFWADASRAVAQAGPARLLQQLVRRLTTELWTSSRFAAAGRLAVPIGVLDGLLRGAVVAGACLLLLLRPRRPDETGWARVAVVAGLLVWWLGCVATACDPWALAAPELVLAALASAAVAGGPWRRRLPVFACAGLLGLVPAIVVAGTDARPAGWSWLSHEEVPGGSMLVELLRDAGPHELSGQLAASALLADPAAPFVRLPEASVRHAEAALALAPDDPAAVLAAAHARTELLDFPTARALASSLVGDDGALLPEASATLQAIAAVEARLRLERLP